MNPSSCPQQAPELLSMCLRHLSSYLDTPSLFRGTSQANTLSELQLLTIKLASELQLSPQEVATLLQLWLATISIVPAEVQLQLMGAGTTTDEVLLLRELLAGGSASCTVVPLALFLQQYLLRQRCFELELRHMVRVFSPLLFNVAYRPQGVVSVTQQRRAERLTQVLVSRALAIFMPPGKHIRENTASNKAASAAPCPGEVAAAVPDCPARSAPSGPLLARSYSELYEIVWRADPIVHVILSGVINKTVTAALFAPDEDEIEDLGACTTEAANLLMLPSAGDAVCFVTPYKPSIKEAAGTDLPNPFSTWTASVLVVNSLAASKQGTLLSEPLFPSSVCPFLNVRTPRALPSLDQGLLKQNTFPCTSGCGVPFGSSRVSALVV